MAKKAKTKRHAASEKRYGELSAKEIRNLAGELQAQVDQLNYCAEWFEEHVKGSLRVDGVTKGPRGLELLRGFHLKLEQAILKEKFKAEAN